jgi:hypothetical protein
VPCKHLPYSILHIFLFFVLHLDRLEPTRSVKIVEGSYGCFIHYKVPPSLNDTPEFKRLTADISGKPLTELHLSMSKGFQLNYNYVDQFVAKIKKSLNKYECIGIPLVLDKCQLLERYVVFTVR